MSEKRGIRSDVPSFTSLLVVEENDVALVVDRKDIWPQKLHHYTIIE